MKIRVEPKGSMSVLSCSGKMVSGDGDVALRDKLQELIDSGERMFVFDMSAVPWMDSGSIGQVVACAKRIRESGGEVALVLSKKTHGLFTLTGLSATFEIHADVEQAIASCVTG